MKDITSLVRPSIRNLKPYSSARDEFEGTADVWLDANENPFNNGLNRYPDPHQKELKWALAKEKNVMPNQVFFGNGSDEIIDLLFRVFCEPAADSALQFSPTYGMYKVSAGINNVTLLDVPLTDDFQINIEAAKKIIASEKPKLIFVCSPNNPTGNLIQREAVLELLKANALVVVDEAYSDFAGQSWISEIDKYPNLVVVQTFSKARGMAGIRLGMAFANPEIVTVLDNIKSPYNVNILTQQTALKALKSFDSSAIETLLNERKKLEDVLPTLPDVKKVYPTDANFILVEFTNAKATYDALVKEGVVVRDRSSQVANTLRISVGTPEENERLLALLLGNKTEIKQERIGKVRRTTAETDIEIEVNLDSNKNTSIHTGLGFFDHMLDQVSKHAKIGLKIDVKGDLHIDEHHTIEDTALALGEAFLQALGDKRGIERYGYMLPMDDCLAQVALDFGGRPWLVWETEFQREKVGELPTELFYHFFKSFSDTAKCNLNIKAEGENEHHKIEAIFKAFARAMKMAVRKEGDELPSTKGIL